MLKYLTRAAKYFVWFSVILALTMTIMVKAGLVEASLESMFRDGAKSVWQIAALFAVLALTYPLTGFAKKELYTTGEYPEIRNKIVSFMESKGYRLEKEEGENLSFRLRSKAMSAFKMWEDRVTFTREPGGFVVEGFRKIIVRLISGLEMKFKDEGGNDYSK